MKLAGAAAIVTGGGSGLGKATAEAFAAKGARVAVLDRNAEAAESVAKAIGGLALAGDVADSASAEAALAHAAAAHGPARILVNCAGVGTAKRVVGRDGPQPLGDFETVIRVNLIGTLHDPAVRRGGESARAARGRRARNRRQHRFGRRL